MFFAEHELAKQGDLPAWFKCEGESFHNTFASIKNSKSSEMIVCLKARDDLSSQFQCCIWKDHQALNDEGNSTIK